jgi:hypothetical protein
MVPGRLDDPDVAGRRRYRGLQQAAQPVDVDAVRLDAASLHRRQAVQSADRPRHGGRCAGQVADGEFAQVQVAAEQGTSNASPPIGAWR